MRNGLAGVGETDGMGDMGAPMPKDGSCIRLGMAIRLELTSNPRAAWSQGEYSDVIPYWRLTMGAMFRWLLAG
jgi:hypothetical protein